MNCQMRVRALHRQKHLLIQLGRGSVSDQRDLPDAEVGGRRKCGTSRLPSIPSGRTFLWNNRERGRKHCDQIGPLPYNWYVLTEEDKQWISERLEKVETTLLTEFHKWASPVELRSRSHAAALRALDAEVESLSDRLKNLEGR